jgi:hypothetical protein
MTDHLRLREDHTEFMLPSMMPQKPRIQRITALPDGGLRLVLARHQPGERPVANLVITDLDERVVFNAPLASLFHPLCEGGEQETVLIIDGQMTPLPMGLLRLQFINNGHLKKWLVEVPRSPWNTTQAVSQEQVRWILRGSADVQPGVVSLRVSYQYALRPGARDVFAKLQSRDGLDTNLPVEVQASDPFGFTALWSAADQDMILSWAAA